MVAEKCCARKESIFLMSMIPILMAKAAYDKRHGKSHSAAGDALDNIGTVFAMIFIAVIPLCIVGGIIELILMLCGVITP